ncbi:MAG: hypothetical protein AAFR61_14315 [Bacteroidota bacterium]
MHPSLKRSLVSQRAGRLLLVACLGLNMIACQEAARVEKAFTDACWAATDTLSFSWKKGEVSPHLHLKMQQDYPYMNLFVQVQVQSSDQPVQTFLLNNTLVDPYGRWLLAGDGPTYQADYDLLAGKLADLTSAQPYQISVVQYMREEKLCKIEQARIVVPQTP